MNNDAPRRGLKQERRFKARIDDPLPQWKLSPMDLESYRRWYDYSRARDRMLDKTDSNYPPLVYRALRRQAAGAPQLYFPYPRQDPVREGITAEGRAAQAIG